MRRRVVRRRSSKRRGKLGVPSHSHSVNEEELYKLKYQHEPPTPLDKDSPSREIEIKIQEAIRRKGRATYSKEYGATFPSLTVEEAKKFMPPSKRSIIDSYESGKFAYINEKDLRIAIKNEMERIKRKIRQERHEIETLTDKLKHESNPKKKTILKRSLAKHKNYVKEYQFILNYYKNHKNAVLDFRLTGTGKPKIVKKETFLNITLKEGYIPVHKRKILGREMVWVQKPTLSGGYAQYIGPYHLRDSKTGEEVRLWEWGVDYDVG